MNQQSPQQSIDTLLSALRLAMREEALPSVDSPELRAILNACRSVGTPSGGLGLDQRKDLQACLGLAVLAVVSSYARSSLNAQREVRSVMAKGQRLC